MARKFNQNEIDLIYEQLTPEEDVLWRGKPNLVPNMALLSTLFFLIGTLIIMVVLRLIQLTNQGEFWFTDWYLFILMFFTLFVISYMYIYSSKYYHKIKNVFYVISNNRLSIFDSEIKKLIYSKRFSTVKVLRLKKTIFHSASIIFDIDVIDDRINEIGFININDADQVYHIVNQQLTHTRNKEN